jgi:prevent-host-death family protein
MGISASDVIPLSHARANFSELAEEVKGGAEKIITKNGESYIALIDATVWTTTTSWSASAFTCC